MQYILPAIISLIFGAIFIAWGIYQIKTGKMVAKNRKYAVDEPREVGVLFTLIGLYGITIAISIISSNPDWQAASPIFEVITSICGIVCVATGPLFMFAIGIYELIKQRIFGVKTTPKTKSKIKKFYRPVALCKIVAGITIPTAVILTIYFKSVTISLIVAGLGAVAILVMGILLSSIESSNKPKSQKR